MRLKDKSPKTRKTIRLSRVETNRFSKNTEVESGNFKS